MTAAIAIIWSQESLPTPPTILHPEHGHTYLPNLASLAPRSAYLPALARHLLPTKIVAQRLSVGGKTTTMHSKVIVEGIVCFIIKEVCCRDHASNAQRRVAAALLGHGRRRLRVHVHVRRWLLW